MKYIWIKKKQLKGFTLIELMMVLAIVAIIAAFAISSYQNEIRKTRRADAQAALMQARQLMERHYSKNYSYATAAAGTTFIDKSPIDGDDEYYSLSLVSDADTFTITAIAQAPQDQDDCSDLRINQAGQKGAKGKSIAATSDDDIDECWR